MTSSVDTDFRASREAVRQLEHAALDQAERLLEQARETLRNSEAKASLAAEETRRSMQAELEEARRETAACRAETESLRRERDLLRETEHERQSSPLSDRTAIQSACQNLTELLKQVSGETLALIETAGEEEARRLVVAESQLAQARTEAEQIVGDARALADRLVADAQRESDRLLETAQSEARRSYFEIRAELDREVGMLRDSLALAQQTFSQFLQAGAASESAD